MANDRAARVVKLDRHGISAMRLSHGSQLRVKSQTYVKGPLATSIEGVQNATPHSRSSNIWGEPRRTRLQCFGRIDCAALWLLASSTPSRHDKDDEDLVAVLESSLDIQTAIMIPHFPEVAKTLPSSHSYKLDGTVSHTTISALLALIVLVSTGHWQEVTTKMKAAVKSAVLALSGSFAEPGGRFTWERFHQTTADHMVFSRLEVSHGLLTMYSRF